MRLIIIGTNYAPEGYGTANGVRLSGRGFVSWFAQEQGVTLKFSGSSSEKTGTNESIGGGKAPALKVGWCLESKLKQHGLPELPVALER